MNIGDQILKCRDDKAPIVLSKIKGENGAEESLALLDGNECSWLKKGDRLDPSKLRLRIEPWLTALFQSEHLGLLVGSGLSRAVHCIATGQNLPGMSTVTFTQFNDEISAEVERSAADANRENGNYIRLLTAEK